MLLREQAGGQLSMSCAGRRQAHGSLVFLSSACTSAPHEQIAAAGQFAGPELRGLQSPFLSSPVWWSGGSSCLLGSTCSWL